MDFIKRLPFKKRFRSPAALAVFGAFAAPEPLGAIMVFCAAIWWWKSRKDNSLFHRWRARWLRVAPGQQSLARRAPLVTGEQCAGATDPV
jgi:hypothetical protein